MRLKIPLTALCLASLLVVALVARMFELELMLYDFDEGVASIYALQLVSRFELPLVGVKTSLGFYNAPLFIYLITPAFALSRSPLLAVAWLQVINIAALAWFARRMSLDGLRWGALLIIAFAALSPGPLLLCRRLWGHALIPAFSIATFLLLLSLKRNPRSRWQSCAIALVIAAAQQCHFSGSLLLINCLAVSLILNVKWNYRWLLTGCAGASLTYVPYIIHLFQTGFSDISIVANIISGGAHGSPDAHQMWHAALYTLTDFGGNTAFQHNYTSFLGHLRGYNLLRYAGVALLAAALIAVMAASLNPLRKAVAVTSPEIHTREWMVLGLVWMLVPLITFSLLHVVTVPAYWLIALPGPYAILVAAFLRFEGKRLWAPVSAGFSGLIALASLMYLGVYNREVSKADPGLVYYPSYRDQRNAVRYVSQASAGQPAVLTQEARLLDQGVDYQILYLITLVESNATRLRPQSPQLDNIRVYILHNKARTLPRDFKTLIEPWRQTSFGLLEVFALPSGFVYKRG